jgi:hypothetical protein
LKIKLKGTIEVIEAESQRMLNTLTGHDFEDEFKKGQKCMNGAYTWKRTTSRVMVASRLKVIDQMAAPIMEIMDTTSYDLSLVDKVLSIQDR